MPETIFTLPQELRDEIYTHVALSSSFNFLLACRQFNEEGTPLLYKHGTYRVRALTLRKERLPLPPRPPPTSLVQNLYISMPPGQYGPHKHMNYEIPRRSSLHLSRFAGTDIRRRVCHLDLQAWTLSEGMVEVLSGFRGFEIVRVEVRLQPYTVDYDGRLRPFDYWQEDEYKDECVRSIEERLGTALGEAQWEGKDSGDCFDQVLIAEFRPRESKQ